MNTSSKLRKRVETRLRSALDEIIKERNYQFTRWTPEHDKGHTPAEWLALLTVYMGKAAMECPPYAGIRPENIDGFRKRVRQIGAICAAILESTMPD
jgi:hypothetical protein